MTTEEFISYFNISSQDIVKSKIRLRLNNKYKLIEYYSFFDNYNYVNISINIVLRDVDQSFCIPIQFIRIDEQSSHDEFKKVRKICNELNEKSSNSIYLIRNNLKNLI